MENLWFLVLIAVVGFVQWILRIVEEKKNAEAEKRAGQPRPSAPPPVTTTAPRVQTTEEERVRKFMEALGVPVEAAPPPPPRTPPPQVQTAPPRESRPPKAPKVRPIDAFPVPRTTSRPPPRPTPAPPPVRAPIAPEPTYDRPQVLPTQETTMFAPPLQPERLRAAASEFDVHDLDLDVVEELPSLLRGAQPAQKTAPLTSGIAARLKTQEGLRDAIVLREIFGPPRSMQSLDAQSAR
ncbi:MAG: hypothetical protein H0V56_05385 [Chthoniobacterales bacterium]|nr:hypothetical protein [Chthoniobacterales bacterium]